MKTRTGFVSNSSSTSFVVVLPKGFDPNTIDLKPFQWLLDEQETTEDNVRDVLFKLVNDKNIWAEENYSAYGVIEGMMENNIIAQFETGPDSGQIIVADVDNIKRILNVK